MPGSLIERDLLPEIIRNMGRKEAIAIRGPRQSGKSTLLQMLKNELLSSGIDESKIIYLSFEDPNVLDEFVKDPRAYLSTFMKGSGRHYLLLDEIQYDRESGRRLKLAYDTMPDVKLIVTGSSTLNVNKVAASLVGRVFLYELLPISFGEYLRYLDKRLYAIFAANHKRVGELISRGKAANFGGVSLGEMEAHADQYMRFGGFPEVVKTKVNAKKTEVLKNIYITYLEKDIPGVFGIADTGALRKTILYLALNIGGLIDYNAAASDTGTYYSKLMQYLSILEETYVIRMIPPFYKNRITELKKNKKAYFFDTGIRNYIVQNFNPMDRRDDSGKLAENFAASELYRLSDPTANLNYWRTTAKAEVDFVFRTPSLLTPIEIKRKNFKKPTVGRSMHSFIKAYKPRSAIIFGRGATKGLRVGATSVYFPSISYL